MSFQWQTIESDPGVFTEMMKLLGAETLEMKEIYSLDADCLVNNSSCIYGIIFLFKYSSNRGRYDKPMIDASDVPNLYFARQTVVNACATQALLHILLNLSSEEKMGGFLRSFRSQCLPMNPEARGNAIGHSGKLRQVHNDFGSPDALFIPEDPVLRFPQKDPYHFVAFVPVDGIVYELDGLEEGPMVIGDSSSGNWLEAVNQAVKERMEGFKDQSIEFNMLAVQDDTVLLCQSRMSDLLRRQDELSQPTTMPPAMPGACVEVEEEDTEVHRADIDVFFDRLLTWEQLLLLRYSTEMEDAMYQKNRYSRENERRKFSYVPFIMELLVLLAEKKKLLPAYEEIKKAMEERSRITPKK